MMMGKDVKDSREN